MYIYVTYRRRVVLLSNLLVGERGAEGTVMGVCVYVCVCNVGV